MTFDPDAILSAIPHRPPFLFVDEIVEWTDEEIVCRYQFKEDEFFFQGHYPGFPIVPGVILCESAMQSGAILATRLFSEEELSGGVVPVVGRMFEIKFKRVVRPGETIENRVSFKEKLGGALVLRAVVRRDGALAASFEFAVTLAPRSSEK